MYNAIAGSCAEDEANGIPVGPSPITLNQAYFSVSATSGAGAGGVLEIYGNMQFTDFGSSNPINRAFANPPIELTTSLSTPTISAISTTETGSLYTLSATTLNNFLNTAQTGQASPYSPFFNQNFQLFMNIGVFLQAPNGLNSLNSYEIVSITSNIGGIGFFGGFQQTITSNFPLQNSLQISRDYPVMGTNNNFNPASVSSNWGILGTGILNAGFGSPIIDPIFIADLRARTGSSPAANQGVSIRYKAVAVNGAGNQEQSFHTVSIVLT